MKIGFDIFRNNMRTVRGAKGISGPELSKTANLKQMKRAHDIEEGRGHPSIEEVVAICKALEVSIDDMLFREVEININFKEIII